MTTKAFEALRARFRERATVHVGTLEQALAAGDRHTVTTIAHKLHGSGSSFGFPKVTELAQPLEAAADAEAAEDVLHRLAAPLLAELMRIAQAV
ncbi:Hpt domain-containing protein [Sphingomonas sp. LHG3406-1]|uniref:Hpt domain-containing protein n=1 Tax=Sphingomonas sp. LHG3406-1 TaxID=2804617 RepID=UPI002616D9D5|nr:Hpt domain-containing protein [Sphingomonas sp. LHG3406-1]